MLKLKVLLLIFFSFIVLAKSQNLPLSGKLNQPYLEHLIKVGVDSVRKLQSQKHLVNDSILYVAALHHANYLLQTKSLSHEEEEEKFKTPQDRALFYGVTKQYLVGENILYVNYLAGREEERLTTYPQLANKIVEIWVNSSKHYKNMIEPTYQVCGLAIAVDEKEQMVYAVQKFAYVLNSFVFKENKNFFKYSKITAEPVFTSFDDVRITKIESPKLPYRLKPLDVNHPNYEYLKNEFQNIIPPFYVQIKGSSVYLVCDYNAAKFAGFFNNSNDAIAIEQVSNVTYNCENPDYFLQPSRRNGKSELNGYLHPPIYKKVMLQKFKPKRKSLKRRYKEVKKEKEDNNFFQNIYDAYKAPYEPTSFKFKVARFNKDIPGTSEFNIVFIKENKIINVKHLTNYCGEFYSEFYPLNYVKDFLTEEYIPNPPEISYEFDFYFKKGKSDYRLSDLKPMLDSLSKDAFIILGSEIKAFSSVEGNEKTNILLQQKRANNLLVALQENQNEKFTSEITTNINWELFKQQIDSFPELSNLKNLTTEQLKDSLKFNLKFNQKIEKYLQKQRYATIKIKTVHDLTGNNLGVYLEKEANRLFNLLDPSKIDSLYNNRTDTLLMIQKYTYDKVKEGYLDSDWLKKVTMRGKTNLNRTFNNLFCFYQEFSWSNKLDYQKLKLYSETGFYDVGAYNFYLGVLKNWGNSIEPKGISMDDLVESTEKFRSNNDSILKSLSLLALNLSYRYAEYFFQKEKIPEMLGALDYLLSYYLNNLPDEETAVRVVKTFIKYKSGYHAVELLESYVDTTKNTQLLKYNAQLKYKNNIEEGNDAYGDYLIEIYPRFKNNEWCDLFLGNCGISFQVFDHLALRNFYCEKCGAFDAWNISGE